MRQYKQGGFKAGWSENFNGSLSLLAGFGAEELTTKMISNAEKFLITRLKKTDCSTFDEYRWEQYHSSRKVLDFNQLV